MTIIRLSASCGGGGGNSAPIDVSPQSPGRQIGSAVYRLMSFVCGVMMFLVFTDQWSPSLKTVACIALVAANWGAIGAGRSYRDKP